MIVSIKRILLVSVTLLVAGFTAFTQPLVRADTLNMPEFGSQPPNNDQGVSRPVRGLTMDDVRAKFGEPREVNGPVGNPPITRWIYKDFTVVFESNYVIDSFVPK